MKEAVADVDAVVDQKIREQKKRSVDGPIAGEIHSGRAAREQPAIWGDPYDNKKNRKTKIS